MRKIVVPEGMLKAAREGERYEPYGIHGSLEAALRWLSENPIVPTDKQYKECLLAVDGPNAMIIRMYQEGEPQKVIAEWQRRMFLTPEPEIPEDVKDLLWSQPLYECDTEFYEAIPNVNLSILEAYRRGKATTNLDKFKDFK